MEQSGIVFISHSSKNYDTAIEIVEALEKENIKCYIAPRDIKPGAIYAEEIVNAISSAICVILIFSRESNSSSYVLKEINSAVNHDAVIIPIRIDSTEPSESIEFYVGVHHWINYTNREKSAIQTLITALQKMSANRTKKNETVKTDDTRHKPRVITGSEADREGWTARRRVIETIEIDYLTLQSANCDYTINEDIEGTPEDWMDYAASYPDTSSFLIVGDKMVGYSQVELLTEDNFNLVLSGETMITAEMEEFYGFGGEFYCYIVIMPILREHENIKNYMLLFDDLFRKIVRFCNDGGCILEYAISSYTALLDKALEQLGFQYVRRNPAGGKIYSLTPESIRKSAAIRRKYPEFYELYAEESC